MATSSRTRTVTALLLALASAACLVVLSACGNEPEEKPLLVSELQIDLGPFETALAKQHDHQSCTSRKPANIGCKVLCKPCFTFFCENGRWVREEVEMPEGMCNSRPLPRGRPASACPRGAGGFCPAECNICF